MTMLIQPFTGTDGAEVDWSAAEAVGHPGYLAGNGSIVFTSDAAKVIHGPTSAQITTTAGSVSAPWVADLPAGTKQVRAHAYVRMPSLPANGAMAVMTIYGQNDAVSIYLHGDGAIRAADWNSDIGASAVAGTLPAAGAVLRVSVAIEAGKTGASVRAAVYAGDSATALWSVSSDTVGIPAADTLTNVQVGFNEFSPATAATTMTIDSLRIEVGPGVGDALLRSETALAPSARPVVTRAAAMTGTWTATGGAANLITAVTDTDPATLASSTNPAAGQSATLRLGLAPISLNGLGLRVAFTAKVDTGTGAATVKLINEKTGAQVGGDKTISLTTTLTDVAAVWPETDLQTVPAGDRDSLVIDVVQVG